VQIICKRFLSSFKSALLSLPACRSTQQHNNIYLGKRSQAARKGTSPSKLATQNITRAFPVFGFAGAVSSSLQITAGLLLSSVTFYAIFSLCYIILTLYRGDMYFALPKTHKKSCRAYLVRNTG